MVSTHLKKYNSQIGSFDQVLVKIKNSSNHHLDQNYTLFGLSWHPNPTVDTYTLNFKYNTTSNPTSIKQKPTKKYLKITREIQQTKNKTSWASCYIFQHQHHCTFAAHLFFFCQRFGPTGRCRCVSHRFQRDERAGRGNGSGFCWGSKIYPMLHETNIRGLLSRDNDD